MLYRLLAHHQEAADPELLEAIMDRIDGIVPLGPVGMIILLIAIVLAVPAFILFLYNRHRGDPSA